MTHHEILKGSDLFHISFRHFVSEKSLHIKKKQQIVYCFLSGTVKKFKHFSSNEQQHSILQRKMYDSKKIQLNCRNETHYTF